MNHTASISFPRTSSSYNWPSPSPIVVEQDGQLCPPQKTVAITLTVTASPTSTA